MFVNWYALLRRAEAARDRIPPMKAGEVEYAKLDALDSIVMSVVAPEAFINEASEMAFNTKAENPVQVFSFGKILRESEEAKASLKLKYMLSFQVFTGESYDDSKHPFQDLHLLLELRNAIVHYKPLDKFEINDEGRLVQIQNKLLKKLQSKNILSNIRENHPDNDNFFSSWLNEIATTNSAKWACETSRSVIIKTIEILPNCMLKQNFNNMIDFFTKHEDRGA